jgi:hypothetical protein
LSKSKEWGEGIAKNGAERKYKKSPTVTINVIRMSKVFFRIGV